MRRFVIIIMAFFLLVPALARASEHDRARDEMRAGQILSLESVLQNVRQQYPGQLLNAHLRGGRSPVYDIKMLSRDGRVTSIICDAKTGSILQVREGGSR